MMNIHFTNSALALFSFAILSSCGGGAKNSGTGRQPSIAAVNYPLAYFAERLAGEFATVIFDCPAGEDPAFWNPSDDDIARIQAADVILLNGAAYAKWAETAPLPGRRTIDTSVAFKDRLIKVENAVTHSHGKNGEDHSHAGIAFTTWIDFKQAVLQATTVKGALERAFPEQEKQIGKNFDALKEDLEEFDKRLAAATKKLKGAPVMASHPIYQYFARAYSLDVHELTWEPEMDLDEKALSELKASMEKKPGARYFMWEGKPLPESVEKLEELD